jgi:hypothetical protein
LEQVESAATARSVRDRRGATAIRDSFELAN